MSTRAYITIVDKNKNVVSELKNKRRNTKIS